MYTLFSGQQVSVLPITDIDFTSPRYGKRKRKNRNINTSFQQVDEAEALRLLKRACPNSCLLTKDESETETASDDEDLPKVISFK
jgi:hypothetical protein